MEKFDFTDSDGTLSLFGREKARFYPWEEKKSL